MVSKISYAIITIYSASFLNVKSTNIKKSEIRR